MAKKPESFRIKEDKKIIVIYTNVEQTENEKMLVEFYLKNGYQPMTEEKKKGKTIAEMRKELAKDEKTLAEFEEAYAKKGGKGEVVGFHKACKIYTEWAKKNK